MTRRPLTARELQQCFAPGDVHLIDDGVTFMVDEDLTIPPRPYVHPLDRTYVPQPLPDWARTVQELPRRRRTCGRLCILATVFAWIVLFACGGALLVATAGVALGVIR